MKCNRCKKKAMEKAAVAPGVSSVAIDGDKVVVIGVGVDVVKLATSLEKKLGFATIESVEETKSKEKKKEEEQLTSGYVVYPQFPVQIYEPPYSCYYNDPNSSLCSIM
ncbi:hypothetical protein TIFTF001_016529 [Ficus carica]|uniref:HMA domain-containing protein n=1 Tax=Ficus carica TaxID=3494 RepID=A0AA88A0I9_FICCA|nr:hypothetical protein TIFTF001_016529 [Ficus carica]